MKRRYFIASILGAGTALTLARANMVAASGGHFEVTRTDAEWRALLSKKQYAVMREESTERAGSSPLDKNYTSGIYHCRGCDLALYSSEHKFDSGTGWPSFYQSLPRSIETKDDRKLFSVRTECHCRRCGSHLGHIFNDGPTPTGKRHCLNGVSLVFKSA